MTEIRSHSFAAVSLYVLDWTTRLRRGGKMPKVHIRDVPEDVCRELERRAALKQISVEDEIREILDKAALQFLEEEAASKSRAV
jgi:hypothetical protein